MVTCDTGDTIGRADEDLPGRPLLEQVMRDGRSDSSRQPVTLTKRAIMPQSRSPGSLSRFAPYPKQTRHTLSRSAQNSTLTMMRSSVETAERSLETQADSVE